MKNIYIDANPTLLLKNSFRVSKYIGDRVKNVNSIFIIAFCSVFVTIIVSIYPAKQASKQDPIKSLKYE